MYSHLAAFPRAWKRSILFAFDLALIPIAVVFAIVLSLGVAWPVDRFGVLATLVLALVALGGPLLILVGTHRVKLTTFDTFSMAKIFNSALLLASAAVVLNEVLDAGLPRSTPVILLLAFFMLSVGGRVAAQALLQWLEARAWPKVPVAIYGAGAAGVQLLYALQKSTEFRPVAMIDDNAALQGVIIGGLKVGDADDLVRLARDGKVRRILLAMPSVSRKQRQRILHRLAELKCEVQELPAYADLIKGKNITGSLRSVSPDSLLGRDKVDLDIPDVENAYAGRSVLVTGAGGSIGYELCRQILTCRPRRLVLYDVSEFALYNVEREMRPIAVAADVDLVAHLGSVTDRARVDGLLAANGVQIVLHAAAYKHVPLLEGNEIEGVKNNVFGTQCVAEAARAAQVERFILVSTDKAVRPANVMGATKRLAELVVRDVQTRSSRTKFAMVRFGNVLGSSGSVIPLFREQIETGGPVTLTHADVTRYFMTIPEAARLVLLAGAYATGGDVFVLDMGEPMKIHDLARRMVTLSGQTVRDESNPDGDIEIRIVGLRPGEKLYEELLVDKENMLATPHDKILRASESLLPESEMALLLERLRAAVRAGDPTAVRSVIETALHRDRMAPSTQILPFPHVRTRPA